MSTQSGKLAYQQLILKGIGQGLFLLSQFNPLCDSSVDGGFVILRWCKQFRPVFGAIFAKFLVCTSDKITPAEFTMPDMGWINLND